MSAPGSRAVIRKTDVDTAQAIIDDWVAETPDVDPETARLPYLRGLITQALADYHAQGYDQGTVRGRRLIAQTVRNALAEEGL